MKIYGRCESCHNKRWFMKKLYIFQEGIGWMTSQAIMCWTCRRRIKSMVK